MHMRITFLTIVAAMLIVAGCNFGSSNEVRGPMAPGPVERDVEPLETPIEQAPVVTDADDTEVDTDDKPAPGVRTLGQPDEPRTPRHRDTQSDRPAGRDTVVTPAPPPTPPAPATRQYVIRPKDTLWSLAKHFLGDGKRWREIMLANPGLDPNKLRVGQTITIPPK